MNAHEEMSGTNNPFKGGMKIKLNDGDGLLLPFNRKCKLTIKPNCVLTISIDLEQGDSLVFKEGDARLISEDRPYPVFHDFKVKNNRLIYELPVSGEVDTTNRSIAFRDMNTAAHSYHLDILHRDPLGQGEGFAANLFGCVVAIPDPNNPTRMFNGTGGWGGNEGGILEDPNEA